MTYGEDRIGQGARHPARYRDPTVALEERVADLLGRMTLSEKLGQMMQLDARDDLADVILDKQAGSVLHASPTRLREVDEMVQRTRLQIPMLVAEDVVHGHGFWPGATVFGEQLALACTFDPDLVERVARVTAVEASATGIHWTFSPVLCVARDPRWGRVGETFGEDPFLIGELGAAMIRGYRGRGPSDPTTMLTTAKHYVGYSETLGGRDASEAELSPRTLRCWFFPPFERAVRENCDAVMAGYQAVEGVPMSANSWLLGDVLREEWGFRGIVVTDWDNVGRLVSEHRVARDLAEASAAVINAGNDMVMSTPGFVVATEEAIGRGLVDPVKIDDAVGRILRIKFALGLFDKPRGTSSESRTVIGCPEHAELNLEVARRALVLLRNNGSLPLDTSTCRRIAVVGPMADYAQGQLGDWAGSSGQVDWMPDGQPRDAIDTVVDGLRAVAPEDWTIDHAQGASMARPSTAAEMQGQYGDWYPYQPAHPELGV